MSFLESVLYHPLVVQWGWVLVHFLWQGAALTLLAAIVLACSSRLHASQRYLLLTCCLYASLALPMLTWLVLTPNANSLTTQRPNKTLISSAAATDVADMFLGEASANNLHAFVPDLNKIHESASSENPVPQTFTQQLGALLPWCVCLWALGVLLLSSRLIGAWFWTTRTMRSSVALRDEYVDRMHGYFLQLKLSRTIRWIESAQVQVPAVIGWLKPIVIVPTSIFTTLTPQEIDSLLLHELVHIRRNDFAANLLQCIVETLFFFHPGIHWLSRQIRLQRELACDEAVLAITGNKLVYSGALLSLANQTQLSRPALAASDSDLTTRIHAVLGMKRSSFVPSIASLLSIAVAFMVIALGLFGLLLTNKAYTQGTSEAAKIERFITEGRPAPNITGRVVNTSGAPVPGATVYLRQSKARDYRDAARTTTNQQGEFAFKDVLIERRIETYPAMDVVAIKEGLSIGWKHVPRTSSDCNITVTMQPTATLQGTLSDTSGHPIANAAIKTQHLMSIRHITQADLEEGRWPSWQDGNFIRLTDFQQPPQATTDDNGRFQLTGIPANSGIILQAIHPKYLIQNIYAVTSERLDVSEPKRDVKTGPLSIKMQPGYQLRLVVKDAETGEAIRNVRYDSAIKVEPPDQVSADGAIELNHLRQPFSPVVIHAPSGSGYLAYRHEITWPADQRSHEVAIALRKGIVVRGSVIDRESGVGISGVPVSVKGPVPPGPAVTDQEGHFELPCPPGNFSFTIVGQVAGYLNGADANIIIPGVTVDDSGPDKSPVLSLAPAPRFRLVVTKPDGNAAPDVTVKARVHLDANSFTPIEGKTNEKGTYVLNELYMRSSAYQEVMPEEVIFRDASNRYGAHLLLERPYKDAPTEQELKVQLVELGTVTGRVIDDQSGLGVQGTQITLFKQEYGRNGSSVVGEFAVTSSDGRFELHGILPDIEHSLWIRHTNFRAPDGTALQFKVPMAGNHDFGDIRLSSLAKPTSVEPLLVTAPDVSGLTNEQTFEKLKTNHEVAYKAYRDEFAELNKKYSAELIVQRREPTPVYCEAMLKIAQATPGSELSLQASLWIVNAPLIGGSERKTAEARAAASKILQTHFVGRAEMAQCITVAIKKFDNLREFEIEANPKRLADAAEALMQANTNREVHARACFYAAKRYMDMLTDVRFGRVPSPLVKEFARKYLTRVKDEFPEYEHFYSGTYGAAAERMLFDIDNMLTGCTPPDLVGTDVTGKEVKLSDYRGKLVLVDFWLEDFGPVTRDYTGPKHILAKANGRVAVIGVVRSQHDTVLKKTSDLKLDYPVFADGERGPFCTKWNIQRWPTEILLDENGVIIYRGSRDNGLDNVLLEKLAKHAE